MPPRDAGNAIAVPCVGAPQQTVDLARQFDTLWDAGDQPPCVFAFLDSHPHALPRQRLDVVLVDLHRKWHLGQRPSAESYCERCPEIAADPTLKLELALGEFGYRLDSNEDSDIESMLSRFPDVDQDVLRHELEELIRRHFPASLE